MISFVVPVYNEEKILETNVLKLFEFLKLHYNSPQPPLTVRGGEGALFQIIISDNASSDKTPEIGRELAEKFSEIKYFCLKRRGKGLAIAEGWQRFPAQPPLTPPISPKAKQGENVGVYMFLDADLSCDLNDIPKFIEALKNGSDVACGSRHLADSKDSRPWIRKFISKIWNLMPKILLRTKLTDTACGIKAVNQKVIDEILPEIKNREWFFDTELVLRAERAGLRIVEIPIAWIELKSRQSKVNFLNVGREYLKNLVRLKKESRIKN
jgi:glycosyltransferase involved in cell wall biosynthesis